MRDPFVNYDSWLEQPYHEQADRDAYEEWQAENTTVECATCGHSFGHPDEVVLTLVEESHFPHFHTALCPVCQEESVVNINVPEREDDYDSEPPDRDDY